MSNPYLTGNFAPVTEEMTVADLEVTGSIPEELTGRYLRNGPNPVIAPDPATYHWFLGDGMVHGLRLDGGRARWYRNRWIRSTGVLDALGEPRAADRPDDFGPNTNVIGHAGRTFALVESGPVPYELTDELDTVGPADFDGTLDGAYTAHPKRDPLTGELHAVAYHWAWGNRVEVTVVDGSGRVTHRRPVETTGSPMVHDMSLTERFAVVYDLPVVFDLDAAMAGSTLPYNWSDDYPPRIGFVPRADMTGVADAAGDVVWVDVDPCFVFHPMNAHDVVGADGRVESVVLDVVRWGRMFDRGHQGPFESGRPELVRWTVDLVRRTVSAAPLSDLDLEFPRVDERRIGRPCRFGYTAVNLAGSGGVAHGGIARHDLRDGTVEVLDLGVGAGQNEAVFVAASPDADEDDGWVLCLTYGADTDTSRLEIRHAQALTDGPVATVHLPVRVPFGFHGNWVPDS